MGKGRKLRILLVNKFYFRKGGAETYVFELAESLRKRGHEVAFFSMKHPRNESSSEAQYFVRQKEYNGDASFIDKIRDGASLVYSLESKNRFEELLQSFHPDIIHLNNVHRQITLSILDAPSSASIPVVCTAHDYILICPAYTMLDGKGNICAACRGGKFWNCLARCCIKHSRAKSAMGSIEAEFNAIRNSNAKLDRVICPSTFMKTMLDEDGYGGRTVHLQNFLSERQVLTGRRVKRNACAKREAGRYFLYFGRLSPEKGAETLLRAFLSQADRMPTDFRLVIAGEGELETDLKRILNETPPEISRRVSLVGYMSGDSLQELVGGAFFSILPSQWYENMPYSGLESLAAGTPVLGARIGGIPELVIEGQTGLGFEPGEEQSLANALVTASRISDKSYDRMGIKCSEYITKCCSQEDYVSRLVEVYSSLLD